jgi:hypothetical protein
VKVRRKQGDGGRKGDVVLSWLPLEFGGQWEEWRTLAAEWVSIQERGLNHRLYALRALFARYLHPSNIGANPATALDRRTVLPEFYEAACPHSSQGVIYNNHARAFLQWVLETRFSEPDDYGNPIVLPAYRNPITVRSESGNTARPQESVHSPLPYRFICEVRDILASGRSFKDWGWAHQAIGGRVTGKSGDWFAVPESAIDLQDPDCVWRYRFTKAGLRRVEMWSPARAVALLVKLTLPLRTHQVRMLDSGEADTWQYASDGWRLNEGPLASGDLRRPVGRGVFRRTEDYETGEVRTALYINTNKTADIRRGRAELGYVIPWQHVELLYWLEKLRTWQTKFNQLEKPVDWTELKVKHLGAARTAGQLAGSPDTCFLFRDAAGSGDQRSKPLHTAALDPLWSKLLGELERRCAARGETLVDGRPLQFSVPGTARTTLYPLHSLRVSLLSSLALDGEVPLVVLSKLVAGHSRLVMTLYYTKVGVAHMTDLLNEASVKLEESAASGLQRFLAEANYQQLSSQAVWNSTDSVNLAVPERVEDRNPVGWMARHHGVCLVGGNTSANSAVDQVGGCHNGGPALFESDSRPTRGRYGPVPGGANNCVRCRWFVTEPRYVDALRAHFNNVSYHLAESAKVARGCESSLELLKARRYAAERADLPFTELSQYLRCERLWETAIERCSQLAGDAAATLRLIKRCLEVVRRSGEEGSATNQLVAVGAWQDLKVAFRETDSEMLQLAGVCDDSEIYPDEQPGKAVIRRSQFLDCALYREGIKPVFMTLSEDEQLTLGNRFMKRLALKVQPNDVASGINQVVGTIESGEQITRAFGLPNDDLVSILETELGHPIARVTDLLSGDKQTRNELQYYK